MTDMEIYQGVHPTLQGELQSHAQEVTRLIRKTSDDLYRIGEILSVVKSVLNARQFDKWCTAEVGVSRASAYRYLAIFKRFSKEKDLISNIEPAALINLSEKKTPEYVVEKAMDRARDGESVGTKDIQNIIKDGRDREKSIKPPPPPRPKDILGTAIPEVIERRFVADVALGAIKTLTAKIQEHAMVVQQIIKDAGDQPWIEIDFSAVIDRAKWTYDEIDKHHPVFVCRSCRGEGCGKCKHRGWVEST